MVETERVRRRRSTSEFFLCFSRSAAASSSSSMKLSSKSILSPGRSRESSVSLSSSLSRRLRSNGSMKGGGGGQASPMFPTGSKKKGGGSGGSFEPPEPSSPKVTCIGQVRVKSKKKHGRKLRTRSQRRGEVSFRKNEQLQDGGVGMGIGNGITGMHHQHQQPPPQPQQRWVHLSLSICETLRAFGAEFSCFYPCGRSSSCSWSGDREKGEKRRGGRTSSSSSCGAVFARWLFALQESEDKHRAHESASAVQVPDEEMIIDRRIERREAPTEIEMEIEELEEEVTKRDEEEDDNLDTEEARTSICIPPKNALLLMRSRSAPFRMSSLANRFWESPAAQDDEGEEHRYVSQHYKSNEYEDEIEIHDYISINRKNQEETVKQEAKECRNDNSSTTTTTDCVDVEDVKEKEMVEKWGCPENLQEPQLSTKEEEMTEPRDEGIGKEGDEGGMVEESRGSYRKDEDLEEERSSTEAFRFEDSILKVEEEEKKRVVEKKEERRVSFSSSTIYLEPESESEEDEDENNDDDDEGIETSLEQIVEKPIEEEESTTLEATTFEDKNVASQDLQEEEEKSVLPECLLMMMCEPKLSMEVSKETWVCSSDFDRCRPSEKKKLVQKKIDEEDANANTSANTDAAESKPKRMDTITEAKTAQPVQPQPRRQLKKKDEFQVQPPRSSCSKVEQVLKKQSMATAVGQKLSNAGGGGAYEPFVLKRCKSEPMRRTDKLSGEVCMWKKNKLETRPPELRVGVGATGVGF